MIFISSCSSVWGFLDPTVPLFNAPIRISRFTTRACQILFRHVRFTFRITAADARAVSAAVPPRGAQGHATHGGEADAREQRADTVRGQRGNTLVRNNWTAGAGAGADPSLAGQGWAEQRQESVATGGAFAFRRGIQHGLRGRDVAAGGVDSDARRCERRAL